MNSYLKRFSMPAAMLALVMLFALPSFAHHPNIQTTFMVDQATQVPGTTLDPNTMYMLKVLKSDTDRHVVQIFNEDGSKMLTTFLGVSDNQSGDQTGFTYMNMRSGDNKVAREWFYPKWGGLKFVYSEKEARDIRQHTNENVLWTKNRISADTTDLEGIQVAGMEPGTSGRSNTEQEARNDSSNLPRTAGELPLLALIGIAFLGSGLAVRFATHRS
jgi:hypothetical protein